MNLICPHRHLPWLLLLLFPTLANAQLTFTTNNNELTVSDFNGGYGGPVSVVIPSLTNGLPVTAIGNYAFWSKIGITDVVIPSSVRNIGTSAFMGCYGLSVIGIPNSVTNIESGAFRECENLKNLTIPDSVLNIGISAFNTCGNLTNATIGDGVTVIGGYAFHLCGRLTNVVIGSAVTNIAVHAFSNCYALRAVYYRGNAPTIGFGVFQNVNNPTNYYLPGRTGWGATLGNRPTALWKPNVLTDDGAFGVKSNQFGFNVNWTRGMTVAVDACANLVNPDWTPLQTNTLAGDTFYFSDSQWRNYSARYYRLRWP